MDFIDEIQNINEGGLIMKRHRINGVGDVTGSKRQSKDMTLEFLRN